MHETVHGALGYYSPQGVICVEFNNVVPCLYFVSNGQLFLCIFHSCGFFLSVLLAFTNTTGNYPHSVRLLYCLIEKDFKSLHTWCLKGSAN